MIAGALASAAAPSFVWLVVARFVLGLGIGGDYPVSAVLMSEYSNRADRGRFVGLVFSMQALGLIVGPLVALVLLASGVGPRPHLAAATRPRRPPGRRRSSTCARGCPSRPGSAPASAASQPKPRARRRRVLRGRRSSVPGGDALEGTRRMSLRQFLGQRRMLALLVGTAGTWFLFDYAYYGNTLSLPVILKDVSPGATLVTKLVWTLGIFVVFALPGYALAVARMDRIGHRRLQHIGFAVIAVAFLVLGAVPALTTAVAPFLVVFGLSYFFIEFGPNTTTFVLPSEVFPVSMRTTGHGVAAGIGKLGAFAGVFLVPQLEAAHRAARHAHRGGLRRGRGIRPHLVLPEPARRTLEAVSGEDEADGANGNRPDWPEEPSRAPGRRRASS